VARGLLDFNNVQTLRGPQPLHSDCERKHRLCGFECSGTWGNVILLVHPEANWPLISLLACEALDLNPHTLILAQGGLRASFLFRFWNKTHISRTERFRPS